MCAGIILIGEWDPARLFTALYVLQARKKRRIMEGQRTEIRCLNIMNKWLRRWRVRSGESRKKYEFVFAVSKVISDSNLQDKMRIFVLIGVAVF